jgi:hypothetical protein
MFDPAGKGNLSPSSAGAATASAAMLDDIGELPLHPVERKGPEEAHTGCRDRGAGEEAGMQRAPVQQGRADRLREVCG